MGPGTVEVRLVLLDQPMQVSFVQDHEVVETLSAETAEEPLTRSVRPAAAGKP